MGWRLGNGQTTHQTVESSRPSSALTIATTAAVTSATWEQPSYPMPAPSGPEMAPADHPNGFTGAVRPPDGAHFPCFDGLRGFAALAILLVHAAYWSGYTGNSGYGNYVGRLEIGVSVFFLISGFLLYRPFAVAHLSGRVSPKVGKFWKRRLLRLVPAYWLALTVITYVFHAVSLGRGWGGVLANYGFLQIYFPSQIFNGLVQAWSLCTEMSFYLFLPIYAAVIAFRRRSQVSQLRRELVGLGVLVVISFAFRDWALNQPVHCVPNCLAHPALVSLMSSWLPSYLDLFALGMFLAIVSAWFAEHHSEPAWLRHRVMPWVSWTLALATFVIVSNIGISGNPIYVISPALNIGKQTLYGAFAFFLLLPAVFGPQGQGAVRRFLRSWPVAAIGVISYGIYLWHLAWITEFLKWTDYKSFQVPLLIMVSAVLGLSILSAGASYFGLELPALRLKNRTFFVGRVGGGRRSQAERWLDPAALPPAAGKVGRLVALSQLHQKGELSDAEYAALKAEIVQERAETSAGH